MNEITHEDNIKKLIDKIPKECSPLERVILLNDGTVQTLMSVIFEIPLKVEVLYQYESDQYIIRWVRLIADYGGGEVITVYLAQSVIEKNNVFSGFINGIRERKMGIGQLLESCEIKTQRELLGFYTDVDSFSRNYIISTHGDVKAERGFKIIITEQFRKSAFKRLRELI